MRDVLTKIIPAAVGSAAGKGLLGAGLGLVAARIARRSLPGAVFVGGAMVAKWLYDKKQEEKAAAAAAGTMEAPVVPPPDAPPSPATPPPANP